MEAQVFPDLLDLFDVQEGDVPLPGEPSVADEDPLLDDVGEGHPAEDLCEEVWEEPVAGVLSPQLGLEAVLAVQHGRLVVAAVDEDLKKRAPNSEDGKCSVPFPT